MEIIVHSTLPNIAGHVTVSADPNHTIDSLITAFCISKGLPHKKEYVIRSVDQKELWDSHKIAQCGLEDGDKVFLAQREDASNLPCGCNQWLLLAVVTICIGAVGVSAITVVRVHESAIPTDYGVVLDGGSSHTQLYIYQWQADKENGTGVVEQIHTCNSPGGPISNYTTNPSMAGPSLKPCLDEAVKQVPSDRQSHTPVFLGATAGMRLLRDSGDNKTSEAILDSIRNTFSTYPFLYNNSAKQVRIISGDEEGTFSWATTNYLADSFGDLSDRLYNLALYAVTSQVTTYGALDMGGASTQITFIPENMTDTPAEYRQDLLLYGADYQVYTHSYLCYGLNEANRQYLAHLVRQNVSASVISSPCHADGYNFTRHYSDIFEAPCTNMTAPPNITDKNVTYSFRGLSNDTACQSTVYSTLFNWSATCVNPPCTFNGVHQPPVYGQYYAFSGFYSVMNFLNTTKSSLANFTGQLAMVCGKNFTQLREYPAKPKFLTEYCFEGHYIHSLLVEGYKFDATSWSNLHFTDKVGGSELGWSLGFMLNSTNQSPARFQSYMFNFAVYVTLLLLGGVLVLAGLIFCGLSARKSVHDSRRRQSEYTRLL